MSSSFLEYNKAAETLTELFLSLPKQFSQLITIQQKLGKENFPLIDQTFYPNFKEMVSHCLF